MFNLGWPEVIIVVVLAIVIFGPKKIPELGGTLGKALRGFKEEVTNPGDETAQRDDDYPDRGA